MSELTTSNIAAGVFQRRRSRKTLRERDDFARFGFAELTSEYLNTGWREESFEMTDFVCEGGGAYVFTLFVREAPLDSTGGYHLSALQVFRWLQQMAIIIIGIDTGATKGELGEVYLSRFEIKCRKGVRERHVPFKIQQVGKRSVRNTLFYNGEFDVGDGCFSGRVAAVVADPGREQP